MLQTLTHSLVEMLCLTNSKNRVTISAILSRDCHVTLYHCDIIKIGDHVDI